MKTTVSCSPAAYHTGNQFAASSIEKNRSITLECENLENNVRWSILYMICQTVVWFLSVAFVTSKLMRGFVCFCWWFTNMVRYAIMNCRWYDPMSATKRNSILIYELQPMLAKPVSQIPVAHTSGAKPKQAWIFMNVAIGHHDACNVSLLMNETLRQKNLPTCKNSSPIIDYNNYWVVITLHWFFYHTWHLRRSTTHLCNSCLSSNFLFFNPELRRKTSAYNYISHLHNILE